MLLLHLGPLILDPEPRAPRLGHVEVDVRAEVGVEGEEAPRRLRATHCVIHQQARRVIGTGRTA